MAQPVRSKEQAEAVREESGKEAAQMTTGARSNRRVWIWAVLLAFPLQVAVLVGVQLRNDVAAVGPSTHIGAYACTNYVHGSTPFRCNFGRLVRNAAEGAMTLNFFTVGATFGVAVLAVALFVIGARKVHLRLSTPPGRDQV
jgi:hypothetical protein